MRLHVLVAIAICASTAGAFAQNSTGSNVPAVIGNRANGLSYQPTPDEVEPREKAAGLAPDAARQRQINDELWRLDAQALKREGLSTKSVPGHPNAD
ncbi:MAG TPA: hypothetical protein VHO91_07620 [Rhodopila sp.]|nr:hypothetical protein [Rhodopila sp.]